MVACEQALRDVLAAGRGKEGELATTSLEFEYLYRKSRCEMLIGGDDISNDVITLGACFHVFLNVYLHSCSFPLRADWRKLDSSVDGEPQGNWKQNSNSRDVVTSSPSFSRSTDRAPRRTYSQARIMVIVRAHFFYIYFLGLFARIFTYLVDQMIKQRFQRHSKMYTNWACVSSHANYNYLSGNVVTSLQHSLWDCSRCRVRIVAQLYVAEIERFSSDLEMKTREQNRNNKRTEIERFD